MLDDGLRQRRLATVEEHMNTEVTKEFDRASSGRSNCRCSVHPNFGRPHR